MQRTGIVPSSPATACVVARLSWIDGSSGPTPTICGRSVSATKKSPARIGAGRMRSSSQVPPPRLGAWLAVASARGSAGWRHDERGAPAALRGARGSRRRERPARTGRRRDVPRRARRDRPRRAPRGLPGGRPARRRALCGSPPPPRADRARPRVRDRMVAPLRARLGAALAGRAPRGHLTRRESRPRSPVRSRPVARRPSGPARDPRGTPGEHQRPLRQLDDRGGTESGLGESGLRRARHGAPVGRGRDGDEARRGRRRVCMDHAHGEAERTRERAQRARVRRDSLPRSRNPPHGRSHSRGAVALRDDRHRRRHHPHAEHPHRGGVHEPDWRARRGW